MASSSSSALPSVDVWGTWLIDDEADKAVVASNFELIDDVNFPHGAGSSNEEQIVFFEGGAIGIHVHLCLLKVLATS